MILFLALFDRPSRREIVKKITDLFVLSYFPFLTWWVADPPDVASPPITTKLHAPHPNYQTTIHRWQPQISGKLGTISISLTLAQLESILRAASVAADPEKTKPVQLTPVSRMGYFSREGTFSQLCTGQCSWFSDISTRGVWQQKNQIRGSIPGLGILYLLLFGSTVNQTWQFIAYHFFEFKIWSIGSSP